MKNTIPEIASYNPFRKGGVLSHKGQLLIVEYKPVKSTKDQTLVRVFLTSNIFMMIQKTHEFLKDQKIQSFSYFTKNFEITLSGEKLNDSIYELFDSIKKNTNLVNNII